MIYVLFALLGFITYLLIRKVSQYGGSALHRAFVKVGDFNGKSYTDFVKACGAPTVTQNTVSGTLCTWSKGKYLIMLEFNQAGKFVSKRQEVLLKR